MPWVSFSLLNNKDFKNLVTFFFAVIASSLFVVVMKLFVVFPTMLSKRGNACTFFQIGRILC